MTIRMSKHTAFAWARYFAEEWRPIAGYEGLYQVSDRGRVYSIRARRGDGYMSGSVDRYGYRCVLLSKDGTARRFKVHRLVGLAFQGDSFNALHRHIAHLDGDKTNNAAENLKWVSQGENATHKVWHGREPSGERNGRAKLTRAQANDIRARYSTGTPAPALAAEYGISRAHAHRIGTEKAWL